MITIVKIAFWQGIRFHTGKSCKGKTFTQDLPFLREKLRRQGIIVKTIGLKSSVLFIKDIKIKDVLVMTQHIKRLLHAGFPLLQSLELCVANTSKAFLKDFIEQIHFNIKNGYSFTESLPKNSFFYNKFHCQLINLGEKTATLELMLGFIADHIEKGLEIKAKIKSAVFYPAIVMIVAIVVFAALLIGVVPQFEAIFNATGTQLPLLTRSIIKISHVFTWICLACTLMFIISLSIFVVLKKKYRGIAMKHDYMVLQIPFFKKVLTNLHTARMSRTMAIALGAGMPLLETLLAIAELTSNAIYKKAILASCERIKNGESFYQALLQQKVIPYEFIQFVRVGEVSASLGEMLKNSADMYEEKINSFVDHLTKLLEPLLIIILGGIIATLMIALYLPIFRLGNAIG
jgi:type IV pilus assembly protein PilC